MDKSINTPKGPEKQQPNTDKKTTNAVEKAREETKQNVHDTLNKK